LPRTASSLHRIGPGESSLGPIFYQVGEDTLLNIKVDGQNMPAKDLESFLPALGINLPKGATIQGRTLNANLNLTGPPNKVVTTGNMGLFTAKLTSFDLGAKMSAISSLTDAQTDKDLQIEKLTTNLRMALDCLQGDHLIAVVPSLGNVVGGGTINSKNDLDFKMAATLTNALGAVGSPVSSATGMIGKVTGGGGGCKSGTTVPVMIQGTTSDPKFVPDVGGVAANMVKSQLNYAEGVVPGTAKGQSPADAVG
jgi:AsmA protein